jgi:hypothetical protein
LLLRATQVIGDEHLDKVLEIRINKALPAVGEDSSWMCQCGAGETRSGRIIKPAGELGRFSVDVVEMSNIVGPSHAHQNS